jgi:hypothetical protein
MRRLGGDSLHPKDGDYAQNASTVIDDRVQFPASSQPLLNRKSMKSRVDCKVKYHRYAGAFGLSYTFIEGVFLADSALRSEFAKTLWKRRNAAEKLLVDTITNVAYK